MDRILLGLGAAGAALLLIAIIVAWWEHRRHVAELRTQLAWSENTRSLLQAHVHEVEGRIQALTHALQAQQTQQALASRSVPPSRPAAAPATSPTALMRVPAASSVATAATKAAMTTAAASTKVPALIDSGRVYEGGGNGAGPPQRWLDTEPMVLSSSGTPDFDPTMPADFSEH